MRPQNPLFHAGIGEFLNVGNVLHGLTRIHGYIFHMLLCASQYPLRTPYMTPPHPGHTWGGGGLQELSRGKWRRALTQATQGPRKNLATFWFHVSLLPWACIVRYKRRDAEINHE